METAFEDSNIKCYTDSKIISLHNAPVQVEVAFSYWYDAKKDCHIYLLSGRSLLI